MIEFRERLGELVDQGLVADEIGVPHRIKVCVTAAKFYLAGLHRILEGAGVESARQVLGESGRSGCFVTKTLNGFSKKAVTAIALGESVEELFYAGSGSAAYVPA